MPLASKMGNLISEKPYTNIFQGVAPKKKMGLSLQFELLAEKTPVGFRRQWSFTQPFRKSGLSPVIWSVSWE